jgi:SAM-dependent methyltransferase
MDQGLKSKAEKYYDNFVGRLLTDYVQSNPRSEHAIRFAANCLISARSRNILDIGCGIGWSSGEFAEKLPQSNVKGLDLSSSLIEAAKILFEKNESPTFSVADITSDGFRPDQKYDGIVMLDLYEHIPVKDRAAFHAAVRNCLKDEFVIILTCPSASFQKFLRENHPELLQPVDEDVLQEHAELFAQHLGQGSELKIFQPISIWQDSDYHHILISNIKNLPNLSSPHLINLEIRDAKIRRIAKTKFKPVLKNFGASTWAKAQWPILISMAKWLRTK